MKRKLSAFKDSCRNNKELIHAMSALEQAYLLGYGVNSEVRYKGRVALDAYFDQNQPLAFSC